MFRRVPREKARFGRVVRGLWPDHNPLRRGCDRAEAGIVAVLIAAFLVSAPLAALATGDWAYHRGLRAAHAQQATWHRVPAVLLAGAPVTWYGGPAVMVPASWVAPPGTWHTGQVPADPGARAGSTVSVWVDASGRLAGVPLQRSQVAGQAILTAMFAPVLVGLALLAAWGAARRVLDRRRLAAWDAEWRAVASHWSRPG